LYARAANEHTQQQKQLLEAGSALKRSQEEKKLQALEAAKKANKGKGKKKGKGAEEDPAEEEVAVAR